MNKASMITKANADSCILEAIDNANNDFISHVKSQLRDLTPYTTASLEWLMLEHYQFSFSNTRFLAKAAAATESFDTRAVHEELKRNLAEENNHAAIYKAALMQIDLDVDSRIEFMSTSKFLETMDQLSIQLPSSVLGTMFATETAAIFEHEVFKDISEEVLRRRGLEDTGKQLVWFHDMHLSGVEQSHRNELGVFLQGLDFETVVQRRDDRPTIDTHQVAEGAEHAIEAMRLWWADLLAEIKAKSNCDQPMVATTV
jgi:hypothetical protein